MENNTLSWTCKLGFHKWDYIERGYGFKGCSEFDKKMIFLGHITGFKQCIKCFKVECRDNKGLWKDYENYFNYVKNTYIKDNKLYMPRD